MTYEVNCSQDDGFVIRSNDETEVIQHVKQHASEMHDMELSDDDARDMMEEM